jgi:hypothetical protein
LLLIAGAICLSGCVTKSTSESLRDQIFPCWAFDAGVPHPERYTVVVRVDFRRDGSVSQAKIMEADRLSDPVFATVAQSALRSVENPSCVPVRFQNGRYLPQVDFVFDLEKAINGDY